MYYDVQPTPKGNLIAERPDKGKMPTRIYFDNNAAIWTISRQKFNSLNSIAFDGKPFTYGGIKFTNCARYDYDEDNIVQKILCNISYDAFMRHGYAWDTKSAYRMSFSKKYGRLKHYPGRPFMSECISRYWSVCGAAMQFIINDTIHKIELVRNYGINNFIYIDGVFYSDCSDHYVIEMRKETNIYSKLPNFTAIITPREVHIVENITLFKLDYYEILSTDKPFKYGDNTLIISYPDERKYVIIDSETGEILSKLKYDMSYIGAFTNYGFINATLPEPPYYVKFADNNMVGIRILSRESLYVSQHDHSIGFTFGYICNMDTGKKTKPAIH